MIRLKRFIFIAFSFFLYAFATIGARADVNAECSKYTDCDMLVACQLVDAVDSALSGIGVDYDKHVAEAIESNSSCKNYPDSFAKDIDVQLTDSVRLVIEWHKVKRYLAHEMPSSPEQELIDIVVSAFGPDTEAQKKFFTALATAYVAAWMKDEKVWLDDAFVLDFLGTDDNVNKYKSVIVELTGQTQDEELGIDVDWDEVLSAIAEVMDQAQGKRGFLVCENNRSWQWSIDALGWIITAVAAIFTIEAGGGGGAAVAAGRAALGAGLKAAARGVAKAGGKIIAKKTAKKMAKKLTSHAIANIAKGAVRVGVPKNLSEHYAKKYGSKGLLKLGVKTFVKNFSLKAALKNKWARIIDAGALVYWIGKNNVKNSAMGTIYSLVESGISKDYVNCQDLDEYTGCYTVCGQNRTNDKLNMADFINTYAFHPMFNKLVCVDPNDYTLHEMGQDGSTGPVFIMDSNKWSQLKRTLTDKVVDKSYVYNGVRHWGCDWNEDDIDMYVGFFVYDPDTLEIDTEAMVVDDFLRLDD